MSAPAQQVWTPLGPAPITTGPYTGRVAAIACSVTDPNRYWVGGADGGVWRTIDGGRSWYFVGRDLPTTSVGAIAVDPTDHNVVWVGTGEGNFANHSRYGLGLVKSIDGGVTWTVHGEAEFSGRCFSRIRVDPQNKGVLYAATTHAGGFPARAAARGHPLANGPLGVFKSTDHGVTWTQLGGGLPTTVSATDVALDPQNPSVVYAAIGDIFGHAQNGVYRSLNGGQTFSKLALPGSGSIVGRLTIALAPSNPQRLFVLAVNPADPAGGSGTTRDVYRSDNGGQTWAAVGPGSYQSTYGWYLCTGTVRPTDPNVVLVGGLTLERSTQGGGSWQTVTPPHVDLHALEWDAGGRLLAGDDGGIHRSQDLGSSWTSVNGNLDMVQFYAGISLDPGNADVLHAGAQDNGSVTRSPGGLGWSRRLGGDGGYTGIDSTGSRLFMEYQGTGNLFRSVNGGSFRSVGSGITGRNCFLPPYEIHPQNPMDMIYGTERVLRSTDGGTSFAPLSPDLTAGAGAVQGLAWAPSDPNVIYASTNDGRVQVTTDFGQNWRLRLTGIPTWPRTTRPFAVHPTDAMRAWFTVGAFGRDQVLETKDAGASWGPVDGDLPDLPVHCIAIDPREGEPVILYAGTDRGVWRSVDGGAHWLSFGNGMPNAPVIDLRADLGNERLVAATQGRGVLQMSIYRRSQWPPRLDPR